MTAWHLEFYGELSAICVALQVGPDSGAHESWNDYMQRFQEWSRSGNNRHSIENIYIDPDLVKDVYIWNTSHTPAPRALRFNAESGRIESTGTPDDLQRLFQRLQSRSTNLSVALRAWQLPDSIETRRAAEYRLHSNIITGWQFDPEIPAIVHPIVRPQHRSSGPSIDDKHAPVDWIVVVLNLDTIQNQVLPVLSKRYFGDAGGLEYKVAVLASGSSPKLIYSSDADLHPADLNAFDSRMNIFGPPPESVEGHFWEGIRNGQSLRGEEWRNFSAPVWFPVIHYAAHEDPWLLFMQHRQGPQAATIANVRRTNLITGGVILVLLAITMVFVVIASQRAQSLANLQMTFVASISHELRTPLAAILSAGQNMTDGFVANVSEYGSIVTAQARQLIDLVDQILLFSAVNSGKTKYDLRPLQVEEIMAEVDRSTSTLLELSGFVLERDVQPLLPAFVADKQALSRCIGNLLGNAVKYSGKSRWICISCKTETSPAGEPEVTISVKDRGIGITASEIRHVFDPFYRSPRVQDSQIHGTGLGLAVVKHMIESMRGRISVRSAPGAGTIFTIHLQVAEQIEREPVTTNIGEVVSK